ncbi:hypothetical protein MED222_05405 [Vibrio sp. MED222]|nr:hypothetical protein MED222_05405 [Vibrio sp. MED222]
MPTKPFGRTQQRYFESHVRRGGKRLQALAP